MYWNFSNTSLREKKFPKFEMKETKGSFFLKKRRRSGGQWIRCRESSYRESSSYLGVQRGAYFNPLEESVVHERANTRRPICGRITTDTEGDILSNIWTGPRYATNLSGRGGDNPTVYRSAVAIFEGKEKRKRERERERKRNSNSRTHIFKFLPLPLFQRVFYFRAN